MNYFVFDAEYRTDVEGHALYQAAERSLATWLRWGVPLAIMPEMAPKACAFLRAAFTRTRSVRSLRRQVEALIAALIPAEHRPIHGTNFAIGGRSRPPASMAVYLMDILWLGRWIS